MTLHKINKPGTLLLLGLATLLLLTAGCSDDDPVTPTPDPDPVFETPDILMQAFATSYEDMDIELYTALLHPDFKMMILQATMDEWAGGDRPLPNPFFTRADEIAIHANIFSGETGLSPSGARVPPVSAIRVEVLEKDGIWGTIDPLDPEFAGYEGGWAPFNVLIYFVNPDNHLFEIDLRVEFYVAPVDVAGQESWHLLGMRTMASKTQAIETYGLCRLKALYRPVDR